MNIETINGTLTEESVQFLDAATKYYGISEDTHTWTIDGSTISADGIEAHMKTDNTVEYIEASGVKHVISPMDAMYIDAMTLPAEEPEKKNAPTQTASVQPGESDFPFEIGDTQIPLFYDSFKQYRDILDIVVSSICTTVMLKMVSCGINTFATGVEKAPKIHFDSVSMECTAEYKDKVIPLLELPLPLMDKVFREVMEHL